MEIKLYAAFLRRWLWLIGIVAISVAIVALLLESQQTPLYAASTTILVNQSIPSRSGPDFQTLQTRERLAKTYAELLLKRPVLEAAIASLKIDLDPGVLASRINVTLIPDTELMVMTVRDPNPQQAADLANAISIGFSKVEGQLLDDPYAVSRQTLYVVEAAVPNPSPVSPNIPRSVLLAAVIGALLAIGGAFLYDYFNDRVKSRSDIERLTGLTTLATIGKIAGSEPADMLVVPGKTSLPIAESYRMVRGHLEGLINGHPIRTLVVTSSVPLEGKSTTAANIAVAIAQTGKRVILVDADVRRPSLHRFFRRTNAGGLTMALIRHGEETAAQHLVATDIDNLQLMPAGPVLANSVAQLGSSHMAALIDELKGMSDLVIFDTSSLLSVVDAQLVISKSDATLLVARANFTRESALQSAVTQLLDAGTPIVGIVLNDAPQAKNYAEYYNGSGMEETIELIDFSKVVNDRQTGNRPGRTSEKQ